jgi:hypothetical protein
MTYAHDAHCNVIHQPGPQDCPSARCHRLDGAFWCDRKTGHRKPHRFELRPVADLHKLIYEVWSTVHPNSRTSMGWVIPTEVRDRLVADSKERWQQHPGGFVLYRPDGPPAPPLPDMLLGRPVRVGGRSILLEVVRR